MRKQYSGPVVKKDPSAERIDAERPFFSIITVCYNAASAIGETIRSVLEQTYPDYEYLFVDGKSSDETLAVIEAAMHGRMMEGVPVGDGDSGGSGEKRQGPVYRVVSEPDQGIYDAMNKAVRMASGRYLYFLNAGDTLHSEDVLEKVHRALASGMARTERGGRNLLYGEVSFCWTDHRKTSTYTSGKAFDYRKIALEHYVCHQAVFARRELYQEHPFDLKFRYIADNEWMAYWSKRKISFLALDLVICDFDMNGESQVHAGTGQALWEADEVARRYWKTAYYLLAPLKWIKRRFRESVKT